MKKIFLSLAFLGMAFCAQVSAQELTMQSPLPSDPKSVVGVLPNGLTYYIRHNEEPKDRASFYIIRNAGAVLENKDQDGLAHFMEHMSFNGTKNFPENTLIQTLQRHGVAFGANLNAYTSFDETVYNISNAPIQDKSLIDTCLLILHDWSHYVSLEGDDIDKERGVIAEEWRTRRNASFRLRSQWFPTVFKGSMYAERDVIGDLDVIKNFEHQTIRDFYNKWYRTDLEGIAIVGDFDVNEMENKVKALFSQIPAVKNPEPRPMMTVPEHDEMYYVAATDKEAPQTNIYVITLAPSATKEMRNTHGYIFNQFAVQLINSMIQSRLDELMQQETPPFIDGSVSISDFLNPVDALFKFIAVRNESEEASSLEALLTLTEQIKRYGFTEGELARAKADLLASIETSYKNRDKIANDVYAKEMVENFLKGEPLLDVEYSYQLAQAMIPAIPVEYLSEMYKQWDSEKNMSVVVCGLTDVKHLTQEETAAIIDKVKKADIEAYKDKVSNVSLISDTLVGSKIVGVKPLSNFNAEEWTLANGARVIFSKVDYEKDDVLLLGFSKGGSSLYDDNLLFASSFAGSLSGVYGVGDFDPVTLNKLLAGKVASCDVSIEGLSEKINGTSTPKDFETMLQLLYLKFEKPRFDATLHTAYMNRLVPYIASFEGKPDKIRSDSLSRIMSNYSKRVQLVTAESLQKMTLGDIENVYRDRIKDASDFTFIIAGNLEADSVKVLVEKYIGSLTSVNRKEVFKDNKVGMAAGKTVKEIALALEVPKSTVVVNFENNKLKYNPNNDLYNQIMSDILEQRYTEIIREKEGGTYGVGVGSSENMLPTPRFSVQTYFDCDPEKAAYLKSLIYKETENLQAIAPTQEELDKVVKNIRKNREQARNHNNFRVSTIYLYYWNGIDFAAEKNYEEILNTVTTKDIQKWSKQFFKGANVVDIIFKPKE